MEHWKEILLHPFTLGLLLGLLVAFFAWKSGFSARRQAKKDIKRLTDEKMKLSDAIHIQTTVNSGGLDSLKKELEALRQQNSTLQGNFEVLQAKPGKAELRQLQVYEIAIRRMQKQAPGFAPAWEEALTHGEAELNEATKGFKTLMRRMVPRLGSSSQTAIIPSEDSKDS